MKRKMVRNRETAKNNYTSPHALHFVSWVLRLCLTHELYYNRFKSLAIRWFFLSKFFFYVLYLRFGFPKALVIIYKKNKKISKTFLKNQFIRSLVLMKRITKMSLINLFIYDHKDIEKDFYIFQKHYFGFYKN